MILLLKLQILSDPDQIPLTYVSVTFTDYRSAFSPTPPTQRTDHPLLATDQSETLIKPVLCSQARNAPVRKEQEVIFDTDSARVGINNRCSGCISHVATDFIGELVKSNVAIKGFAGSITRKVMKGMLRWKWTNDDGRTHKHLIPDSFYVPNGGACLLSPQHWAQTQKDRKPTFGTGEWTKAKKNVSFTGTKKGTKGPSTWIRVDQMLLPCDLHLDTMPSKPFVLRQR